MVATSGVVADPSTSAAVLVANVLALAGGGLLWRYGRPTSWFGYLLLAEAVPVLVSSLAGSSSPVSYLIGILALWVTALGATWLLLAFPGARPRGSAAWVVMGTAAATLLVGQLPRLLISTEVPTPAIVGRCLHACPANAALLIDAPRAAETFRYIQMSFQTIWGIGLLVFLAAQLTGASFPRRRLLVPVFAASVPFVAAFTVNAIVSGLFDVQPGVAAHAIMAGTR